MQVFETKFSVHVTFKGMCKCFSVLPTRSEDKNDLTLLDIFAVFLDFESRMVFLIMRFFLPKLVLPEIGN